MLKVAVMDVARGIIVEFIGSNLALGHVLMLAVFAPIKDCT